MREFSPPPGLDPRMPVLNVCLTLKTLRIRRVLRHDRCLEYIVVAQCYDPVCSVTTPVKLCIAMYLHRWAGIVGEKLVQDTVTRQYHSGRGQWRKIRQKAFVITKNLRFCSWTVHNWNVKYNRHTCDWHVNLAVLLETLTTYLLKTE